jgi:nucleotide-binding universal stress UspA family protein
VYRSLLVPLDGSHFSEHALLAAAGIARRQGVTLMVVRVVPSSPAGERKNVEAADAQALQEARTYLRGVVHRLAGAMQVQAHDCVLNGEVVDSLLEYVGAQAIDLVVITTHRRRGLSRLWLGSIADELLRRLPIPLLLVRPQKSLPEYSRKETFRNVLIPLDGSPEAKEIVNPVLAWTLLPRRRTRCCTCSRPLELPRNRRRPVVGRRLKGRRPRHKATWIKSRLDCVRDGGWFKPAFASAAIRPRPSWKRSVRASATCSPWRRMHGPGSEPFTWGA